MRVLLYEEPEKTISAVIAIPAGRRRGETGDLGWRTVKRATWKGKKNEHCPPPFDMGPRRAAEKLPLFSKAKREK